MKTQSLSEWLKARLPEERVWAVRCVRKCGWRMLPVTESRLCAVAHWRCPYCRARVEKEP